MQIQFDISGHTQIMRNLKIIADNISGNVKREFHHDAIDLIEKKSLEIFKSGGRNLQKSPSWASLAPSTLHAREKRWGYYKQVPIATDKPLIWTGRLMNSRRKESTTDYGLLQFMAPYAEYHQRGGGRLPQRALIDLDNNLNKEIVRLLQTKIHEEIGIFGRQA